MKKLLLLAAFIACYIQSNPLHDAAERGDLATVKKLIEEENYDPNKKDDELGWTALHYAAFNGYKRVVACLIEQSKYPINPNLQDKLGRTALSLAFLEFRKDAVTYLTEQSKYPVNLNIQDNEGWSVLLYAIIYGHKDSDVYLIEQSKYDINPNLQDKSGKTALHHAASKQKISTVKTLLYYGADIAICDNAGKYPFDYATVPEIKKLLTPSNPEEFKQNPEEYKKKHPLEFDPVNRFPEEFIDFDKRTLEKKLKNQNTTNTAAYLFNRSIGATIINGKFVSDLMNP